MMSVDAYLEQVRRRLGGMDARIQADILRELRSHLAESAESSGGDVGAAIAGLGEPSVVAKRYKELYGYGLAYRLVFALLAGLVGVFTIPALFATEETIFPLGMSVLFLLLEVGILLWISVSAGNVAGVTAGIAGCLGRIVAFAGAYAANRAGAIVTADGMSLFLMVSLMLIVLGWLPGQAKRAWKKPGAEL